MSNQAAWIDAKGAAIQVKPAEIPAPGPGELVIEVCFLFPSPFITNQWLTRSSD